MKILLLAGTYEARILSKKIESSFKYSVIVSLAGVTKEPLQFSDNMRFGGFGGINGLKDYIINNNIKAVIDATHPFAQNITRNAKIACEELNISRILFEREPWSEKENDKWVKMHSESDLLPYLKDGDVVFVASGKQSVKHFKNQKNIFLICRQIDAPKTPFPYANGRYLIGRPPFSIETEKKLFKELNISWLLVKNSGGSQSQSKLIAARKLGINIAMLNRPAGLGGKVVSDLSEVMSWLEALKNG